MSKFHKNAIITSCIDSYCLVCDSYLRSEEDANSHIEKTVHRKNLNAVDYLQKYKDDHIRKVKTGYFCEFCNILISTATKAGLHIAEQHHIDARGSQLLKRVGNSVIACNDLLISEKAWNGLIEETCVLCNMEFYNEHIHKTEQTHVLNLIQMKVEFGPKQTAYRKIDDTSFQCLTCNMVFALKELTTHWDKEDHNKRYEQCRQFDSKPLQINVQPYNLAFDKFTAMKKEKATDGIANSINTETVQKTNAMKENVKPNTFDAKEIDVTVKSKSATETEAKHVFISKCNENKDSVQSAGCTNKNKAIIKPLQKITMDKSNENKIDDDGKCQPAPLQNRTNQFTTIGNCPNNHTNDKGKSTNKNNQEPNDIQQNTVKHCKTEASTQVSNLHATSRKKLSPKKLKANANNVSHKHAREPARQYDKAKILDNVPDFQKKGVNINFEIETAYCKNCCENIELNYDAIHHHIEEHNIKTNKSVHLEVLTVNPNHNRTDLNAVNENKNLDENHNLTKKQTPGADLDSAAKAVVKYVPVPKENPSEDGKKSKKQKATSSANDVPFVKAGNDPISFAKAHKLTFNKGNSNAFCRLCGTRIPASMRSLEEHVNGAAHRNKLSKVSERKAIIPKRPMKKFIKMRTGVHCGDDDDIVINDRFCVSRLSYLMITKVESGIRYRCQTCEVHLFEHEIDLHAEAECHEEAMNETPVVWTLETEFIREVRPGLFHCGFCNLIAGCWEDVDKHLSCPEHRHCKVSALRRLQTHMPDILEHRQEQEERLMKMFMLGHLGGLF